MHKKRKAELNLPSLPINHQGSNLVEVEVALVVWVERFRFHRRHHQALTHFVDVSVDSFRGLLRYGWGSGIDVPLPI